jgi:hypothetical protein
MKWHKPYRGARNLVYGVKGGKHVNPKVFLSYNSNDLSDIFPTISKLESPIRLDSEHPETAIVLVGDKENGNHRFLIYRGDWRRELAKIYPDISRLKKHWRKYGGHFWSDDLESDD